MSFEMLGEIYPDSKGLDTVEVSPPKDLKKYIEKLKNVKRFQDKNYHLDGMIDDNTKDHTIRCVYRARTIPYYTQDLERILWIHDIPEYVAGSDASALERFDDQDMAEDVEDAEVKVARETFDKEDLILYEDYHMAEEFIRKHGKNLPNNQQTLVANVIDYMDGNLVFHYYFSKWLLKNDYNGERPTNASFVFVLKIRESTIKAMEDERVDSKIKEAIYFLLSRQLNTILDRWKKVNQDKIPTDLKTELLKMKNLVCC